MSTLDYVACPLCKKNYVQVEADLVCEDCAPLSQIVLGLNMLYEGLDILVGTKSYLSPMQKQHIESIIKRLSLYR